MNKNVFVFVMGMFVIGCGAGTTKGVSNASDVKCEPQVVVVTAPPPKEDTFDSGGKVIATGSRFVWNAGKGAWEWVTSEEVTRRAKEGAVIAWDFTKRGATRIWESVKVLVK